MKAKYITVLDYEKGEVNVYPIELWDIENEDIENAITNLEHNPTNCEWMIHSEEPRQYNNLILK